MDDCKEHKDKQLQDYFLNRLSPEETASFQFHLLHCEACRIKLERMRRLANEEEEVVSPARRLDFSLFTRVAAVAGLLVLLAGGGYYFTHIPSDEDLHLEMNEPPVFHSGDSVVMDTDSTVVETKEKEEQDAE
ncbi:zf-HC2 domain-containing protein [Parabacteroides acidifaciens]|uniref:Zf-HC2 domain-containing protein n=1 Tax=Parabacteroides acidifaciens TaxID=2290935 RepID=A0A3D8HCH5_9BACT|nr:zf-HC2 domain-containing protein [Parabacteroides acidifaciens]MBC8602686.1 zf-HC2 domain-containing protein [Parabacteroides acidifaciens]RDU48581.1 zf-HC2 domain-containing protein [Parabacteroides acidifaciens]